MKKGVIILVLLLQSFGLLAQSDWVTYLQRANSETDYCLEFNQIMEKHQADDSVAKGYFGISVMMLSKLYKNPFTKLSYFNQGKKILEASISVAQENVELRFLRFAVQTEIPAILLYFENQEEDKKILDDYIKKGDTVLGRRILRYYELKELQVENLKN